MEKVCVGVVGVGHLGQHHARIYSQMEGVELVGVVDTNRERAKEIADKYGTTPYFDHRQLIGRVDAVSIAVPTDLHFPIAQDYLRAGVHCLVEKPITETIEQAESLLEIAREENCILQVGHIERYNTALQSIIPRLKKPLFIECERLAPYKGRGVEVGVVLDLMIHDIDIVLSIVKSPISQIDALGVEVLTATEDIANARITFENGAVANLTASRVSQDEVRKMRIFQPDSYISLDYLNQEYKMLRKEGKRIVEQRFSPPKEEPLRLELADFIRCVAEAREPQVSGEHGKRALALALHITHLVRERRKKFFA